MKWRSAVRPLIRVLDFDISPAVFDAAQLLALARFLFCLGLLGGVNSFLIETLAAVGLLLFRLEAARACSMGADASWR